MGYKKPAWKKQLADAKQRNRDLDNVNHELQVEVLRLSKALADSEATKDRIEGELLDKAEVLAKAHAARTQKIGSRPLTDVELSVLAQIMLLEALPETPARRAVIDRLAVAVIGDSYPTKDGVR